MDLIKLTEKVSAWANAKGNTKAQLCEVIGVSANTLTSRLQGETEWTWKEAITLAKFMQCSLDDLAD